MEQFTLKTIFNLLTKFPFKIPQTFADPISTFNGASIENLRVASQLFWIRKFEAIAEKWRRAMGIRRKRRKSNAIWNFKEIIKNFMLKLNSWIAENNKNAIF